MEKIKQFRLWRERLCGCATAPHCALNRLPAYSTLPRVKAAPAAALPLATPSGAPEAASRGMAAPHRDRAVVEVDVGLGG
ncbi:hypothetical protein CNECB9_4100014 [Cupriavidus necator]|uniref:Uncharacterized protein n=1 Tax=Cupriavidus necator TaxID=106590 RepID=A0A1K0JRY0_CUPNE|nr:hypothetical protein CNECB9_4100014 [Cupriavidus necator]